MACMNAHQPELPIPDLAAWMTRGAVAVKLGVDPSTVSRWMASGVLTARYPRNGGPENAQPLFWVPEVDELAAARARVAGRAQAC